MSNWEVVGPRPLRGQLRVPGCKGISHRALLFAAIADGESRIRGLAGGDDVARTRGVLEALGVAIAYEDDTLVVRGKGVESFTEPSGALDCGNSGTTMRMGLGLLAGRPFVSRLAGDDSLSRRPMARVVEPLRAMGAVIDGHDGGDRAPLMVEGRTLTGRRSELSVASAQVKTALVLAGLQASGVTEIVEPATSRDHTERMLGALDAPIEQIDERALRVHPGAPEPFEFDVPGDASSAAFFVVAALVTPGSEIVLEGVSLNPGRIGYLEVLTQMGADIEIDEQGRQLGEPVGNIAVRASALRGAEIRSTEAIIDEIPALAVAAAFAEGFTVVSGAAELRVKESDRIATLVEEIGNLGIVVAAADDGLTIRGGTPSAGTFESHGDHRIAMAMAVAANAVEGTSTVGGWEAVASSYPEFTDHLAAVTQGVER